MARSQVVRWLALAGVVSALIGCGGSKQPVPVSGVVTLDGKPLKYTRVTFNPVERGGHMAVGMTDEQGRFTLTTFEDGDGALPGEYKVTFYVVGPAMEASEKVATDLRFMMKERERLGRLKPEQQIHDNYKNVQKTPVTQKVPAEGEVRFELTKEGT